MPLAGLGDSVDPWKRVPSLQQQTEPVGTVSGGDVPVRTRAKRPECSRLARRRRFGAKFFRRGFYFSRDIFFFIIRPSAYLYDCRLPPRRVPLVGVYSNILSDGDNDNDNIDFAAVHGSPRTDR